MTARDPTNWAENKKDPHANILTCNFNLEYELNMSFSAGFWPSRTNTLVLAKTDCFQTVREVNNGSFNMNNVLVNINNIYSTIQPKSKLKKLYLTFLICTLFTFS